MIPVQRISHATLDTTDLDRAIEFYVGILGLSLASRDANQAYFSTSAGQLALKLQRGELPHCSAVAFQTDPNLEMKEVRNRLVAAGIGADLRRDSVPGVDESLCFDDPKGTAIEVFAKTDFLKEDRTIKGIVPLKLGHLAFKVLDIQKAVAFYRDTLGFRVSDWRQDFFVFMRCGPDHHTVNFATGAKVKMHHIAFELKDAAELLRACDFLGRNRYPLLWGPGRHVIGDNIFAYFRDPDGHIVELYAELARMDSEEVGHFMPRPWHEYRPYRPTTWGTKTLSNLWGPGPPPGFGD